MVQAVSIEGARRRAIEPQVDQSTEYSDRNRDEEGRDADLEKPIEEDEEALTIDEDEIM